MLIHGQQAEPGIVRLRDGPARPVFKYLADFEVFEISSERHTAIKAEDPSRDSVRLQLRAMAFPIQAPLGPPYSRAKF
jgi:hypothetical protein